MFQIKGKNIDRQGQLIMTVSVPNMEDVIKNA